jgi:small subunit ribosomal protein S19
MAIKEFKFKGKSLEELQTLSVSEFAQIIPSRQRRSLLRGLTDQHKILLKNLEKKDYVKTHCRDMIILPKMVGKRIQVYNGKTFVDIIIQAEMIGHYLGEFSLTRRGVEHHAPGVGATKSSSALSVR